MREPRCRFDRDLARSVINRQPVTEGALESMLPQIFEHRRDKTLYVMGAGTLPYGDIVDVIDAARGAGVNRVRIVTEAMRGGNNRQ
jgi:biopolymer transport protein ExbD